MAKLSIKPVTTSKLIRVYLTKLSDGTALTGVVFGDITAYYIIEGAASAVAITLQTMTVGTWATGGFKEIDSTNMPGWYELGVPNAAFASGKSVGIQLKANGGTSTGMANCNVEIQEDASAVVQYAIHKNTALTAFQFQLTLASDHVSPYTGAANTITGYINIDGVKTAWSAGVAGSLAAVTGSNGDYYCNFAAADLNGNNIEFVFNAPACDTTKIFIATQA